eukprot:tig00020685_g12965.t1
MIPKTNFHVHAPRPRLKPFREIDLTQARTFELDTIVREEFDVDSDSNSEGEAYWELRSELEEEYGRDLDLIGCTAASGGAGPDPQSHAEFWGRSVPFLRFLRHLGPELESISITHGGIALPHGLSRAAREEGCAHYVQACEDEERAHMNRFYVAALLVHLAPLGATLRSLSLRLCPRPPPQAALAFAEAEGPRRSEWTELGPALAPFSALRSLALFAVPRLTKAELRAVGAALPDLRELGTWCEGDPTRVRHLRREERRRLRRLRKSIPSLEAAPLDPAAFSSCESDSD